MEDKQVKKLIAEIRERVKGWRRANDWIDSMEQRALENPDKFGPDIHQYVLRNRRNLRRFIRSRFGVHFRYRRHRRPKYSISRRETRDRQMGWPYPTPKFSERFPLAYASCSEDRAFFKWYTAWESTLYWFDGAQIYISEAHRKATKVGANANLATVRLFAEYCRMGPWMQVPTEQADPDPVVREEYAKNLAGWARWRISFATAKRLKEAIRDSLGPKDDFMEKFYSELLPAVILAYHEMQPGEPLIPAGHRQRNFISRVEEHVEKATRESVEKLDTHEQLEETLPDLGSDKLIGEFEMLETVRQHVPHLPPRQRAVILRVLDGMEDEEIAEELKTSKGNVQTLKSYAIARLGRMIDG